MVLLRFATFGLRFASAGAKFFLVIYITAAGSSTLLGQIALVTTIVAIFIQVAGLEINQVIGRKLNVLDNGQLAKAIYAQALLCLFGYILLIPPLIYFYRDLVLPYWFTLIVVLTLEHFITEVYRLKILRLKHVSASALIFIKNVLWVAVFIALSVLDKKFMTLQWVLYCWAGVLIMVSIPLAIDIFQRYMIHINRAEMATRKMAFTLLSESKPFIASSVLIASVGAIDKLLIGRVFKISELGEFFFYSTLASILTLAVTFSVGSISGPHCIMLYSTGKRAEYKKALKKLKFEYFVVVFFVSLLIISCSGVVLALVGKDAYMDRLDILIVLVASAGFICLCDSYKLEEYLKKRDGCLLIGNFFHMIFLVTAVGVGSVIKDIGVVALCIMFSSIFAFLFFAFKVPRRIIYFYRRLLH